ncbi:S9 family peptidase [Anaerolineae bacterium CFX9]|nr:S9 family peptidase [Anaerolineae bacterium CFX9]
MHRHTALFGTWASPIQPRHLAGGNRISDAQWDGDGETLVWLESRAGQTVLVARRIDDPVDDALRDLTEGDQSVRGRLFYGGGEFTVAGGNVYFVGDSSRLYVKSLGAGRASALTPAFGTAASPALSLDGRWLAFVHSVDGDDGISVVDLHQRSFPQRLVRGSDFVMQPCWSPDGSQLAFVAWNQPNMAFDGTELRLLTLQVTDEGLRVTDRQTIAGDEDTSIFQPAFSPDGRYLAYVSDRGGWWQLYVYDLSTGEHRQLTSDQAEYGIPAWLQGMRTYGWTHDSRRLLAIRNAETLGTIVSVNIHDGTQVTLDLPDYTHFQQIHVDPVHERFSVLASATDQAERLIAVEFGSSAGQARLIARSSPEITPKTALSLAEPVRWTGEDGQPVYGLYYPPASERYTSPGAPPLIVYVHGGPTSQSRATYAADMQFFATRGFAVLQVNHRGGTGYGKAYKDLGRGNWGVYEVADSASGASWLAEQGLADPEKFVILGSSSGGFAVLQSLVERPGFYAAGVCRAGVANQFSLIKPGVDKFEARYSEMILGPLPEALAKYRERSPVFHAHRISDPLFLAHGLDDHVVPPENSQQIADALREKGVPHELYLYAGEGHSFRKPETIADYYGKMLAFLERYVIYR